MTEKHQSLLAFMTIVMWVLSWLRAGADLVTVQKLLGHASVQTTQVYLNHLDQKELKRWAREL